MKKKTCNWTYDEWHDVWETECGGAFCIGEGKPSDNNMNFCCYCGRKLVEVIKKDENN